MSDDYHWPDRQAVETLNRLLHLPATGKEQDWELELADDGRIAEWTMLFRSGGLDLECRSALGLLILSSLVVADPEIALEADIAEARLAFREDPAVRARLLSYAVRYGWLDDDDGEEIAISVLEPIRDEAAPGGSRGRDGEGCGSPFR